MMESATIASVNAALAHRMEELARELSGADSTTRRGDAWRFRSRGSLAVIVAGPKRGAWHDHEAGIGGDPLGFIAHLRGVPMREAFSWAFAWLGEALHHRSLDHTARPSAPSQAPHGVFEASDKWSGKMARTLLREAEPAAGTLTEVYLTSRGLTLPADAPLRFHPRAWRNKANGPSGPAMIAPMTATGSLETCGVHVTYLQSDGIGKASGVSPKVMLGTAGVIRLVPDEDVTAGLGLAEGIETSLAVMQRVGWRPIWAATSAGAIARFPVLAGIEALTVFADADGPGMRAARQCCRRWAAAGREPRILAPPAGDWDDALLRAERAA